MAQPTRSDWKIDVPLTNMSIAYMQMQSDFVADKVFPVVPTNKRSDKYYIYDKTPWLRDQAVSRAPLTPTAGGGFTLSNDTFYCDHFGFHQDVDNNDIREEPNPLNLLRDATDFVTRKLLIRRERYFVTNYFASSVWGTDSTPSNLWDNYSTSDPTSDIEAGITAVYKATGFKPNTLLLGYEVYAKLKHHPDFVDRYKHTSSQSITAQMLGAVLDIPNVYVAGAVYDSSEEGATAAPGFAFGKNALLVYVNPSNRPTLRQPSAGYMFSWTGFNDAMGTGHRVRQFEIPEIDGVRVEGELCIDAKVTGSDLGYFFSGAIS